MTDESCLRHKRTVCGWCPMPLPNDDPTEWSHHFLVVHHVEGGHSVRHYYDDDPLERMLDAS